MTCTTRKPHPRSVEPPLPQGMRSYILRHPNIPNLVLGFAIGSPVDPDFASPLMYRWQEDAWRMIPPREYEIFDYMLKATNRAYARVLWDAFIMAGWSWWREEDG